MDNSNKNLVSIDMNNINRCVHKQDFIGLQKMLISTNSIGADICILLGMCTLLHTEVKALREEVRWARNNVQTVTPFGGIPQADGDSTE